MTTSSGPSLQFIGTATTVLRLGGFTLLTDPNFLHRGERAYLGRGLFSKRLTEPALGIDELPPLDAVLLSHLHGDHFDRRARNGLDKELPIVSTRHAARRLRLQGFTNAVALDTWASHELRRGLSSLTITSLPGRHAPGLAAHVLPPVMGSLLEFREGPDSTPFRLYITGDTLLVPELQEIKDTYPEFDAAVVHLGGTRILGLLVTMDGVQGADLLQLMRPPVTVPVHYGDYGVFKSPLSDFRDELERRQWTGEVRYVNRGDAVSLSR
ncbi:MAG TPA: MBL fold metallo-hydrolase [Frankiaceae bacterium]|nr:MBL fold metallo-hydrolase [Frankiaceae bacterium]